MFKRLCFVMVVLLMFNVYSQEHQSHFPPEEFKARWEKVFDLIGESVAIMQGAPDNGGFIYPRQTNSFYYLCGVTNFNAYLVLDGRNRLVTLYLPPSRGKVDERVLSLKDTVRVKLRTGVDRVLDIKTLVHLDSRIIYTPFSPAENQGQSRWELLNANQITASDYWDGRVSREEHFVALLRSRYPRAEIKDLSPILDSLRTIKSAREIELIRRASKLAALGIKEAMQSTIPGINEYQLDAAARYVFQVNGAKLEGYRSITASGVKNISDGHYYFNSGKLKKGDLVLMDYAPDYGCYVSDIGRMWPVDGKFLPWQKELCGFILSYHKAIVKRIRPGVTPTEIMEEVKKEMGPILDNALFSKPAYEKAVRKMVETGGGVFSHMVGMAVHDVGRYFSEPLRPGLVFAVDPQLRVPDENLYMRIEDTVVVTEDGVENLTRFAPSELDDIENNIRKKGMVQRYPPIMQPLKVF